MSFVPFILFCALGICGLVLVIYKALEIVQERMKRSNGMRLRLIFDLKINPTEPR